MEEFKEMTDNDLYWFAVFFLNGADYNSDEDVERWKNFRKEVENRSYDLKKKISHLMEVI